MKEKKIKIQLLVTILLVISFSVCIVLTKPYTNFSKNKFDWFWVNKTHYLNNADILVLGDSRTYRGISAEAMNSILPNKKIINLGYSSTGLSSEYFNYALTKLNPKNEPTILIGITPFSLTDEARKNEHLLQELNRPTAEIIERKYIYPYLSYFESIKIIDYFPKETKSNYFQEFHKNGWVKSYKIPTNPNEAIPIYKKELSQSKINKESIKETLTFVEKATKKGIKIYGFRPPSTKKMELLEDDLTKFNYSNFIKHFEANGGEWIELPSTSKFNSYDGSHLHYLSAKKLSIILAKKIRQK